MADLFAYPHFAAYLTLAVLAAMFLLFVLETYPVEVTAMVGAAVLVVCGVVPSDGVLKVFSNPAPWTIAAMFIVSGGLVRREIRAHHPLKSLPTITRNTQPMPRR